MITRQQGSVPSLYDVRFALMPPLFIRLLLGVADAAQLEWTGDMDRAGHALLH